MYSSVEPHSVTSNEWKGKKKGQPLSQDGWPYFRFRAQDSLKRKS